MINGRNWSGTIMHLVLFRIFPPLVRYLFQLSPLVQFQELEQALLPETEILLLPEALRRQGIFSGEHLPEHIPATVMPEPLHQLELIPVQ